MASATANVYAAPPPGYVPNFTPTAPLNIPSSGTPQVSASQGMQAGSSLATSLLDAGAAKRTAKKRQALANEATALQGLEFDKRFGWVNQGNKDLLDLSSQQHQQTGDLSDELFQHIMSNNDAAFNEQQGINSKAFDDQNTALGGMMTAQRAGRLDQKAASDAEEARQLAIQDQADGLSSTLPDSIGYGAQEQGAADALAKRTAFTAANTTAAGGVPAYAQGDGVLAREFAKQQARGAAEANLDATNHSRLAATGDAFQGAGQNLSDFASAIQQLTTKAGISRSALPAELQVGATTAANAKDAYAGQSAQIADEAKQRAGISSDYYTGMSGAENQHGQDLASVLANYFGDSMGSRANLTAAQTGASSGYENARTSLFNQKIQGTNTTSPLSTLIKIGQSAFSAGKSAGA